MVVFDFVSFSAASVGRASSIFSLKMTLESWSISEFDVKYGGKKCHRGVRNGSVYNHNWFPLLFLGFYGFAEMLRNGPTDGPTERPTDEPANGWTDRRTNWRTDWWTYRQTNKRTDGRTNGRVDALIKIQARLWKCHRFKDLIFKYKDASKKERFFSCVNSPTLWSKIEKNTDKISI